MFFLNHTSGGVKVSGNTGLPSISCGAWHTLAISDSGDLYSWGWGRFGQLGYGGIRTVDSCGAVSGSIESEYEESSDGRSLERDIIQSTPKLVDVQEATVVAVSAGVRYSVVVLERAQLSSPHSTNSLKVFGCVDPSSSTARGQTEKLADALVGRNSATQMIRGVATAPWHFVWY